MNPVARPSANSSVNANAIVNSIVNSIANSIARNGFPATAQGATMLFSAKGSPP